MASPNTPMLYSLATMQAFLDGTLDPETVTAIETLLAEDRNYADAMEALDRLQATAPGQREADQQAFREQIASLGGKKPESERESYEEPLVRDLRSARWWQIAAVILLLALPMGYWLFKPQPTLDQLAMQHLEPYTFSGTRGAGETRNLLSNALDFYESGRQQFAQDPNAYRDQAPMALDSARILFQQVLLTPIDSLGMQQYLEAEMGLGLCLLFQGYPAEAQTHFEPIVRQGDNIWLPAANWYKAWSLLLLGQKDEAIAVLSELSRHKSDYRLKAQELLDELE